MLDAVGAAHVYGFSSGAILALTAARRGLPIRSLALMEPPLGDAPPTDDLRAGITALVEADRRGDAVELFHTSIGVPADMIAGMRQSPVWPVMAAVAHTLVYDLTITPSLTTKDLAAIPTPTLVIDSEGSDERLRTWARGVAAALPGGSHRSLPGGWHGVAVENLAAAVTAFCR